MTQIVLCAMKTNAWNGKQEWCLWMENVNVVIWFVDTQNVLLKGVWNVKQLLTSVQNVVLVCILILESVFHVENIAVNVKRKEKQLNAQHVKKDSQQKMENAIVWIKKRIHTQLATQQLQTAMNVPQQHKNAHNATMDSLLKETKDARVCFTTNVPHSMWNIIGKLWNVFIINNMNKMQRRNTCHFKQQSVKCVLNSFQIVKDVQQNAHNVQSGTKETQPPWQFDFFQKQSVKEHNETCFETSILGRGNIIRIESGKWWDAKVPHKMEKVKNMKRETHVCSFFFSESERRNDEKTTKFSTDVLDASWESFGWWKQIRHFFLNSKLLVFLIQKSFFCKLIFLSTKSHFFFFEKTSQCDVFWNNSFWNVSCFFKKEHFQKKNHSICSRC